MSVSLMIDSQRVEVEENTTILDAAKKARAYRTKN